MQYTTRLQDNLLPLTLWRITKLPSFWNGIPCLEGFQSSPVFRFGKSIYVNEDEYGTLVEW